jgi:hypothetical protein
VIFYGNKCCHDKNYTLYKMEDQDTGQYNEKYIILVTQMHHIISTEQ